MTGSARCYSLNPRWVMPDESLKLIYQELCSGYRAIDDFRAKLLGFLPLATGAGVVLLSDAFTDQEKRALVTPFLGPIGAFGFVVTLGLLAYEIHGIMKCARLITLGQRIEKSLGPDGQFLTHPEYALGFINKPFAAALIYPAVLAAWMFVATCGDGSRPPALRYPVLVFAFGFTLVFLFGRLVRWLSRI